MTLGLGRIGIFTSSLDLLPAGEAQAAAREIEALGYGALWVSEAARRDALVNAFLLLAGTERLMVATGIANIYARDPMAMKAGWFTVSEAFPERFLLGLGVSHAPLVEGLRGGSFSAKPLRTMRAYLDGMDSANFGGAAPVGTPRRCLGALGPGMLALAAERTDGAHPYLVTPEHTAGARALLGPGSLLAPAQFVVLETDAEEARAIGRRTLTGYFGFPNYVASLRRQGFTDADLEGPSDRMVDALVAWGDAGRIRHRVEEHLTAGADHVALNVLAFDDHDVLRSTWRALADEFELSN